MKFMRGTTKYTRQDYKTNEDILVELEINPVVEKIKNYINKWVQCSANGHRHTATLCYEISTMWGAKDDP
jgi:hypothetical protein